jgi:hypothetical protein
LARAPPPGAARGRGCTRVPASSQPEDEVDGELVEALVAALARAERVEVVLLGDIAFAQHLAGRNAEADRAYQSALDRLLREPADQLVVDLGEVTFMDTFALRALLALQEDGGAGSLHVVPGTAIQRVLDLAGFRSRLRWISAEQLGR